MVKYNFGCGPIRYEGWINVENIGYKDRDDHGCGHLPITHIDLINGEWPTEPAEFIFTGHFLSQLTPQQGLKFIKNCFTLLKSGGVLRIAENDVLHIIKCYLMSDGDDVKFDNRCLTKKVPCTSEKFLSPMHQFWTHIHRYNWKFLYDEATLDAFLTEAGFIDVKRCHSRESEHPELRNLDHPRTMEVIMEATKP